MGPWAGKIIVWCGYNRRQLALRQDQLGMLELIPTVIIKDKIYVFRGQKVMVDRDLAKLYGVSTKVLNQSVNRNLERFPNDFMFKLTLSEATNLRSQFVTSSSSWGGLRWKPYVFTEGTSAKVMCKVSPCSQVSLKVHARSR